MVRDKQAVAISKCFIDPAEGISVLRDTGCPFEYEFGEGMPLPGSATYGTYLQSATMSLDDYVAAKKVSRSAWPLFSFSALLEMLRRASRLCRADGSAAAMLSATAVDELLDIAVRVYGQMSRSGSLGANDLRFQVRMYLHLQYASLHRKLHASALAMLVFDRQVDLFVSRLPASVASSARAPKPVRSTVVKRESSSSTPRSGCWLCVSPSHFANDQLYHSRKDGKPIIVKPATKQQILHRIQDNNTMSLADKKAETSAVKAYWAKCEK